MEANHIGEGSYRHQAMKRSASLYPKNKIKPNEATRNREYWKSRHKIKDDISNVKDMKNIISSDG